MMLSHISSLPAARHRKIPPRRGTLNDAICDNAITHHGNSRTPVLAAYRHGDHCANSQPHDFMDEHYESDSEIWAVGLASCLQGFLGPQSPLNSLWEGLLSGTAPERLLPGAEPTEKSDPERA